MGQTNNENYSFENTSLPAFIDSPIKIKSISCGSNHTVAVTFDGRLWGFSPGHGKLFIDKGELFVPKVFGVKNWYNVKIIL